MLPSWVTISSARNSRSKRAMAAFLRSWNESDRVGRAEVPDQPAAALAEDGAVPPPNRSLVQHQVALLYPPDLEPLPGPQPRRPGDVQNGIRACEQTLGLGAAEAEPLLIREAPTVTPTVAEPEAFCHSRQIGHGVVRVINLHLPDWVVGPDRDAGNIALVAGPRRGDVAQWNRVLHGTTMLTLMRTRSRSTKVGCVITVGVSRFR